MLPLVKTLGRSPKRPDASLVKDLGSLIPTSGCSPYLRFLEYSSEPSMVVSKSNSRMSCIFLKRVSYLCERLLREGSLGRLPKTATQRKRRGICAVTTVVGKTNQSPNCSRFGSLLARAPQFDFAFPTSRG